MYYLGYFENKNIKTIKELSEEEYTDISRNVHIINKLLSDGMRLDNFNRNYDNIIKAFNNCTEDMNIVALINNINGLLTAYLSSFKKFSDNWETELTREYGKNSSQLSIFKKALADQYDNNMEYRIIYRLRNYDQHCGDIVSNIKFFMDNNTKIHKIYMDRDYLLSNFDKWKVEEKDYLSNCDKLIEVLPFIKIFHQCVLDAYKNILLIHSYTDLINCCSEIIKSTYDINNNIVYIYNINNTVESNKLHMEYEQIDKEFIKDMLRLFIKSNQPHIVTVFCGDSIREKLSGCAIEVNITDVIHALLGNVYTRINDKIYKKCLSKFKIAEEISGQIEFYGVYTDASLDQAYINEVHNDYELCIQTLMQYT